MSKNILILQEVVRTRVMRVHSTKLNESIRRGFVKKPKFQKRLCANILLKKGASNG